MKKIAITTHRNADADALGASLSLYEALKNDDDVSVIVPTDFSDTLKFMPHSECIVNYSRQTKTAQKLLSEADRIYILDYNCKEQLKDMAESVEQSHAEKIMIDHHETPTISFDTSYSDPSACSASLLVYLYLREVLKAEVSPSMAENIYTGIIGDTGMFQFPKTSARTHQVVAELFELGANHTKIVNHLQNSYSENRLKYLIECLNTLEFFPEHKTVLMSISQEMMKKHDYQLGFNDGFVNWGLRINDYEVSVLVAENEDKTCKISFRSKGNILVNEFSNQYFNGGGHQNAAGGYSEKSLAETVQAIKERLKYLYF